MSFGHIVCQRQLFNFLTKTVNSVYILRKLAYILSLVCFLKQLHAGMYAPKPCLYTMKSFLVYARSYGHTYLVWTYKCKSAVVYMPGVRGIYTSIELKKKKTLDGVYGRFLCEFIPSK